MMHLETPRLYLRPFHTDDAGDLYRLNQDPDVLAYTGDAPFESVAAARRFIENYDQYHRYGVGRCSVIEKKSQCFIGWCGLKYTEITGGYDIGFRFFKNAWNLGFATESAFACISYGFNELKLESIIGRAMKDNLASIAVLKKLGLRFVRNIDFEGHQGMLYEIDKEGFLRSKTDSEHRLGSANA